MKNNKSIYFKDWTTPYLKKVALELYDSIHGLNPCYGTKDVIKLQAILTELDKRGIQGYYTLNFN